MSIQAIVSCNDCGWILEGQVPTKIKYYDKMGGAFGGSIKQHHVNTRRTEGWGAGFFGHENYTICLEDGRTAAVFSNSELVYYKPLESSSIEGGSRKEIEP